MTTAALAGSTGLVGSHILATLLAHPSITAVSAYTRRDLPNPTASTKLTALKSTDIATWPSLFPTSPTPSLFLSGLGTTRATAGGLEGQRAIDYQLNLDLASAAAKAGATTYVLISASSANSQSNMAYPRMKGELEDAVQKLGFKYVVLLRPGLIVGGREETRVAEAALRHIAKGLGTLWGGFKDPWAQDAEVIARAAVKAGLDCIEGNRKEGVWVVSQAEIIRLGRTEWK